MRLLKAVAISFLDCSLSANVIQRRPVLMIIFNAPACSDARRVTHDIDAEYPVMGTSARAA